MGTRLQRARMGQLARLAALTSPQRVLIVGEGEGSFLCAFVRRFPQAAITVVDPSAGMVARSQARLRKAGLGAQRIEFVVQALLEAPLPEAGFDLIVTLFFFDNFENAVMRQSVAKLRTCAGGQAYWLLADFCLPDAGWRRLRAKLWLKILYRFFGVFAGLTARELPDTEAGMEAAGCQRLARQASCGDMLFSALYRIS